MPTPKPGKRLTPREAARLWAKQQEMLLLSHPDWRARWRESKQSMRDFIADHREEMDAAIRAQHQH